MSTNNETIEADFKRDVSTHRMTVKLDDGLYRHLEFRKPEYGWHHWFEVVTWPNCLCIRGDMGTWTFSRIQDMFGFFRGNRISPHYWQEKLQHGTSHSDRSGKKFSIDTLRRQVISHLDNWELTEQQRANCIAELENQVLCYGDYEEHAALDALFAFGAPTGTGVSFDPCDGPFGLDWSYHYLWCCWAIVWAIEQYDARRAVTA